MKEVSHVSVPTPCYQRSVSIALDALNGELLELVSYLRLITLSKATVILMLVLLYAGAEPDGSVHRLLPPRYTDILEDSSLKPDITIQQLKGPYKSPIQR